MLELGLVLPEVAKPLKYLSSYLIWMLTDDLGVLMRFITENTGSTLVLEPESTEICAKLSDTNGYTAVMFSFTCGLCIDCMHGCV